jgi:hypothetical protein
MRRQSLLIVLAFVTGSAGCASFVDATARNFTELPIQACDEVKSSWRNRRRAEAAWDIVKHGVNADAYTRDYAAGFKDGYQDYLDNGGHGEPPAIPPFRYRQRTYQTPDGLRAIDDWNSGFRHGSAIAHASGYRETIVIPLSSPPINAIDRDPILHLPATAPSETPPPAVPPTELLPQPKKTDPRQ